jgi:hypothetical protein
MRPGTGKEPIAGAGPPRCATRPAADRARDPPPPPPAPPPHPPRQAPRQQQQDVGRPDVLSSATGPSTARCSKDVTTHQHQPGARPGLPCPVPARSGQPLPGERRLSPPFGEQSFSLHLVVPQRGRNHRQIHRPSTNTSHKNSLTSPPTQESLT